MTTDCVTCFALFSAEWLVEIELGSCWACFDVNQDLLLKCKKKRVRDWLLELATEIIT